MLQRLNDNIVLSVCGFICTPYDLNAALLTCKRLHDLVVTFKVQTLHYICSRNILLGSMPSVQASIASLYEKLFIGQIILVGGQGFELQCDTFDIISRKFTRRCWLGIKQSEESTLSFHNGYVFAIPGFSIHSQGCIEALDILYNRWVEVPPLPQKLSSVAACSALKRLYVMGGYNKETGQFSSTIYELQDEKIGKGLGLTEDAWREVSCTTNTYRTSAAAACYRERIWIVGGFAYANSSGQMHVSSRTVEIFDPKNGTVCPGPTMCEARPSRGNRCGLFVVRGVLYAVGGNRNCDSWCRVTCATIECFDECAQSWRIVTKVPFAWLVHTSAAVGSRIYLFGAKHTAHDECMYDFFDVCTETWGSVAAGLGTEKTGCFPIPKFTRSTLRHAMAVTLELEGHPMM